MKYLILITAFLFPEFRLQAQFAPAAGFSGTTAIHKDDVRFVGWATGCSLNRGWQDISDTTLGRASAGNEQSCIGSAGEHGIASLGDGGEAIVTFDHPITNGSGFDFAIFENGFPTGDSALAFLEFAFVEVSSDGQRFVRFPATSNIQDTAQLAMVGIDASLVNNLAGKYANSYGTPFDLEELKDSAGLDVNRITYIKVIDVIGSVDTRYASYDINGKKVNDPWPTPFPTGGFDLDAVGVIHSEGTIGLDDLVESRVQLYPNPVSGGIVYLSADNEWIGSDLEITDMAGKVLFSKTVQSQNASLSVTDFSKGIYLFNLRSSTSSRTVKLIVE